LNDGACALVLMSAERAEALGIQPLARWSSTSWCCRPLPDSCSRTGWPGRSSCRSWQRW
jgi:hypothetical protein